MKKTVKVEGPCFGSITVEYDLDYDLSDVAKPGYMMMDAFKDMVDFWSGSEGRLNENEGDVERTFLKQLCEKVLRVATEYNYNTHGMIEDSKEWEGYFPLDGSLSLKLVDFEEMEFSQDDFEIEEL